jgi:insertion element IS1 protein InsB
LTSVNPAILRRKQKKKLKVRVKKAEADEFWSFVGRKSTPRWTWYLIDHDTGEIIAFVMGRRTDATFRKLLRLLKLNGIRVKIWFCDDWGAYPRCLNPNKIVVGKANTQTIERKNLDFRTRIKRLQRRTNAFSKSIEMHDAVIALFINRVLFNT